MWWDLWESVDVTGFSCCFKYCSFSARSPSHSPEVGTSKVNHSFCWSIIRIVKVLHVLMVTGRKFQRTKECVFWVLYEKVMQGHNFIGRWC